MWSYKIIRIHSHQLLYQFFSVFSSRSWPNIIIVLLATPCSLSLSQLAPCLAIGAARYPSPRWMRRLSLHKAMTAMITTLRHVECFCHSRQCPLRGWRCLGRTLWAAHRTCKGTWSSKLHIENMSEMIDSRKLQFASFRRSGGAMKYLYASYTCSVFAAISYWYNNMYISNKEAPNAPLCLERDLCILWGVQIELSQFDSHDSSTASPRRRGKFLGHLSTRKTNQNDSNWLLLCTLFIYLYIIYDICIQ